MVLSLTCLELSASHLPRLSWGPERGHILTAQQGTPFNRAALAAFHIEIHEGMLPRSVWSSHSSYKMAF